jgi:hypothetical protein
VVRAQKRTIKQRLTPAPVGRAGKRPPESLRPKITAPPPASLARSAAAAEPIRWALQTVLTQIRNGDLNA